MWIRIRQQTTEPQFEVWENLDQAIDIFIGKDNENPGYKEVMRITFSGQYPPAITDPDVISKVKQWVQLHSL